MANTKNAKIPSLITIGNAGNKFDKGFVPYKQNLTQYLQPGQSVALSIFRSGEVLYYEKQATDDLLVGVSQGNKVNAYPMTYNPSTGTFTLGATYSFVQTNTAFEVIGELPYMAADPALGLLAGNRLSVKIRSNVASKSDLGDGVICKVTNGASVNEYTKNAFENDGSLLSTATIAGKSSIFVIQIKWAGDVWTTYTFSFANTLFQQAN